MGKKKQAGEYNDFLDGEKLRDNAEVRTSLQAASTRPEISPPPGRQGQRGDKKHGKGGGGQKRPPLTHFLCLPLVTDSSRPQLERGLNKLKGDLESNSLVPTKAVRPLGTLHLTLGVMSLDETRLEDAKRYLQDLDLHILLRDISIQTIAEKAAEDGTIAENLNAAAMPDTDGLTITLAALVPMQSPQKTSILYASPQDSTQRLLPFASALKTHFTEQGFMLDDGRALRLHATIINTIYAKPGGRRGRSAKVSNTLHRTKDKVSPHQLDSRQSGNGNAQASDANREDTQPETGQGHGPDANSWMRFDASELIAKYKDFVWAQDVRIESVQICRMGAKKVWSGGEEGEGEVLDERYEVVCEKGIFE
jgi:activating signal cointegrator complex subunit 1